MPDRVLILAPRGRDSVIAGELLGKNGFRAVSCASPDELVAQLQAEAGAIVLTEEALVTANAGLIGDWVRGQPTWSDIPVIVLANGTRSPRSTAATERLGTLGNVVLLERPLHAEAMVGAVRSALKARARQFELREAAETLERAVEERTAELEAARESLEIALDAAEMGSWDMDLLTGAARRTRRFDEIFGYAEPLPHWDLKTFLGHVDPSQRKDIADAFAHAQHSSELEIECRIMGADGRQRWIVAKGRMRYDAAGKPVRITGVVSDFTDRKDADAQLAQAQKMDAIGQLTGGVAHDFNNLLTPIVGTLDVVRRRHKDDERTQRMIGGALQAAERATTLTQRLLSFARRQTLQPKAVDIGSLIDGIVDLIRRSLGPSISVKLEIPRHLPAARVDPNQLELALLNLAINARDAMPAGGKLILSVTNTILADGNAVGLEPGNYICIVATDTGVGMDRVTLTRATEPFFSTKGVGKGTGLGLSMIHGLAAQSGGLLTLNSEPGVGTSAELWLPATEETVLQAEEKQTDPILTTRSATILLVDDEDLVRAATADMLRDIGYRVTDMGSASQALAAIRSGVEADLLISDYLMPGMTGGQLINELRTAGIRMPTLLVTGYAAAGNDVPDDVPRLAKPFRQTDLAVRVNELLLTARARRPNLKIIDKSGLCT